ncbi:MAG TPA: hypothetical protein VJ259_07395 [Actinomycetota bacterium]|nr:hypothetical protein [Actinomycetota bacterium]
MVTARRWLWTVWGGVVLGLVGQMVDLAWHARHGAFRTASDVLEAHWLTWLAVALTIAAALSGARSGHERSKVGFAYIVAASVVNALAHMWNAWEHVNGSEEPILPHVLLALSGAGVLVAAFFTVHLLFGRDEHPGLFKGKERAGVAR